MSRTTQREGESGKRPGPRERARGSGRVLGLRGRAGAAGAASWVPRERAGAASGACAGATGKRPHPGLARKRRMRRPARVREQQIALLLDGEQVLVKQDEAAHEHAQRAEKIRAQRQHRQQHGGVGVPRGHSP